jgi:hypothetical protein
MSRKYGVGCDRCMYAGAETERCFVRALLGVRGHCSYKTIALKQGYCEYYNARTKRRK